MSNYSRAPDRHAVAMRAGVVAAALFFLLGQVASASLTAVTGSTSYGNASGGAIDWYVNGGLQAFVVGASPFPTLPTYMYLGPNTDGAGTSEYTAIGWGVNGLGNEAFGFSGLTTLTQLPFVTTVTELDLNYNLNYLSNGTAAHYTPVFVNFGGSLVNNGFGTQFAYFGETTTYQVYTPAGVPVGPSVYNFFWVQTPNGLTGTFDYVLGFNFPVPAVPAGDYLNVQSVVTMRGDPASISLESVPEPSSLALCGIGAMAAVVMAVRRRK